MFPPMSILPGPSRSFQVLPVPVPPRTRPGPFLPVEGVENTLCSAHVQLRNTIEIQGETFSSMSLLLRTGRVQLTWPRPRTAKVSVGGSGLGPSLDATAALVAQGHLNGRIEHSLAMRNHIYICVCVFCFNNVIYLICYLSVEHAI